MGEGITYEQLFDALRREKSRDDLQQLDKDFYDNVRIFLRMKEDTIAAQGAHGSALAAQRATIEYQNVKKILKELYERRERKIITLAQHKTRAEGGVIDTTNLLMVEREFYDGLIRVLHESRERTLSMTGKTFYQARPEPTAPQTEEEWENDRADEKSDDTHFGAQATPPTAPTASQRIEISAGDTYSQEESDVLLVRFLTALPKFFGSDKQVFGPFQQDQEAQLPAATANILIRKGKAVIVE